MPVTHGVAGSSPVQTARFQKHFGDKVLFLKAFKKVVLLIRLGEWFSSKPMKSFSLYCEWLFCILGKYKNRESILILGLINV
jgi:hypothetical protein